MQILKSLWKVFWAPTARFGFGAIFVVGGIAGIIFWGGFNTYMEYTNTLGFCISCHEMEQTVYQEYKQSPHYKNASGVRATCSDCHVPREWTAKLLRKIQASNELLHKVLGTIDTPEKFEAKRMELAQHVWKAMQETDSRECRNCHSYESMDFHKQKSRAAKKMQAGMDEGKTCIDCHKGIAHELPEEFDRDDDED